MKSTNELYHFDSTSCVLPLKLTGRTCSIDGLESTMWLLRFGYGQRAKTLDVRQRPPDVWGGLEP